MAFEHGLILVDTKYEFGKASDGTVLLIDEVRYHFYYPLVLLSQQILLYEDSYFILWSILGAYT